MYSFVINIITGEKLTHEDFVLLTWEKAKERYERCCGKDWDAQDNRSKAICYSIQQQDMFNLNGWRLVYTDWSAKER